MWRISCASNNFYCCERANRTVQYQEKFERCELCLERAMNEEEAETRQEYLLSMFNRREEVALEEEKAEDAINKAKETEGEFTKSEEAVKLISRKYHFALLLTFATEFQTEMKAHLPLNENNEHSATEKCKTNISLSLF